MVRTSKHVVFFFSLAAVPRRCVPGRRSCCPSRVGRRSVVLVPAGRGSESYRFLLESVDAQTCDPLSAFTSTLMSMGSVPRPVNRGGLAFRSQAPESVAPGGESQALA
jgi:hypothetical protein